MLFSFHTYAPQASLKSNIILVFTPSFPRFPPPWCTFPRTACTHQSEICPISLYYLCQLCVTLIFSCVNSRIPSDQRNSQLLEGESQTLDKAPWTAWFGQSAVVWSKSNHATSRMIAFQWISKLRCSETSVLLLLLLLLLLLFLLVTYFGQSNYFECLDFEEVVW